MKEAGKQYATMCNTNIFKNIHFGSTLVTTFTQTKYLTIALPKAWNLE